MSASVAVAAGLLEILQILEVAHDAAPIIKELSAMGKAGKSFEEILEAARNYAVTSESDAQAAVNAAK